MKTRYFVLIYLAINLILALLVLEIFFRFYPKYNLRYNLNQYAIRNSPMNVAMKMERNRRICKPSPILGYEIIPNSATGVNSFGMVGQEHKLKKEQDTYRILVLGDSITEKNWYVEKLQEKLNNSHQGLKYNFEVWNGAVMGYQVNQYAAYLKHKGLRYNPDMVLIGFCLNDLVTLYYVFYKDENGFAIFYNPARELSKTIRLNEFLFKHSYFYRFLILKTENLIPNTKEKIPNPRDEGLYYLKIIKDICQERKIPLLVAVFPYLKNNGEYADYEKDKYKDIIGILEALKIDYIDLHKDFPEEKRYKLRSEEDDYIHPNIEGHEIAANAIYEHLMENYFLVPHKKHVVSMKYYEHIALPK